MSTTALDILDRQAYRAAIISRAAYCLSQESAEASTRTLEPKRVMRQTAGTCQLLIVEFDDVSFIAFRGTDYEDIITDLHVRKAYTPHGRVHSGFLRYANQSLPVIDAYLRITSKPVILTGHSLGGAAAQIVASTECGWFEKLHGVITFGSPRVGDHQFANSLNSRIPHLRYVNANDGVSYVPWFLGTYKHSKQLRYFTIDGRLWVDPNPIAVLLDRWNGFRNGFWRWASDKIGDHSTESYISRFEEITNA